MRCSTFFAPGFLCSLDILRAALFSLFLPFTGIPDIAKLYGVFYHRNFLEEKIVFFFRLTIFLAHNGLLVCRSWSEVVNLSSRKGSVFVLQGSFEIYAKVFKPIVCKHKSPLFFGIE